MRNNICIFLFAVLASNYCSSQITLVQFSTGYSSPLDIKNAGDDRLFIVEQGGRIRITDTAGVKRATPFLNISSQILTNGEQGLLGLAFDPNYKNNGFFYVDYVSSMGGPDGETHISRFKVSGTNPDSADPASEKVLLVISQPYPNHNGGNLMFGSDGYLYISMGDGGLGGDPENRAQNPDSLLGKILRIDVNDTLYKIPADNPFVNKPGRDEIWAYGVRNPWRASFDRWTGDLWIGEVGQDLYEEVDYEKAGDKGGENYGWRCYEGNHTYNTAGCGPISNYTFPVLEYPHSTGGIAVVGGYCYRGAEFANMFGKYFYTDEATNAYGFHYLLPNGSGGFADTSLGALGRSQIVTFGEDRWGELYVADYANASTNAGAVYKFKGESCSPVAFLSDSANLYVCDTVSPYYLRTPAGKGFHYQWFANGSPVPGNDNDTLVANGAVNYYVVVTNGSGCTATSNPVHLVYPSGLTISGLDTFTCVDHAPLPLSGSPSGGVFTGAGVSNQTFYPDSAGLGYDTVIYVYTNNISGCTSSTAQIVHVDACLNTTDYTFLSKLNLYPNPNQGEFRISFYLRHAETLNLEIKDVLGRSVYKEQRDFLTGSQSFSIKPGLLARGVYTLCIKSKQGSHTAEFVVE